MRSKKSGYYTPEQRKAHRERPAGGRRRAVMTITDLVMVVVSVAAAVALLAALLAKVIDPRTTTLFAFAGLVYQLIYIANVATMLWWVVRWRRWFVLSLAMVLLGYSNISLFYRSDMKSRQPEVERSKEDLVVASFNVASFNDPNKDDELSAKDIIAKWVGEEGVQLICLQESYFHTKEILNSFKEQCGRMNYSLFISSIPEKRNNDSGGGFTILSAYPIVRHGIADEDESNINAVWADVKIGRDTLRVVNAHLQSTGIDNEERSQTLTAQIIDDTLAKAKLSKVAHKMMDNYRKRAIEADNVAQVVSSSPYPVVVCGDFNDPPVSYTYRTIRAGRLLDSFVEGGRGTDFTFKGLYNLFRIDYILPDEEHFDIKEYGSFDLGCSDHKAVRARLLFRSND
ncbi:MAG: endonuclease/exonuclease/phosphatase family protein [Tidjanibacter sp.]|nr:endonuclease/exonuclease/phosphatase family protein [Tidjanibacter sp.]